MNRFYFITIALVAITGMISFSGFAVAGQSSTLEGTIQGANCTIHKTPCPLNSADPHTSLERDFVFVSSSGKYYFLTNLSRVEKMKYLNSQVRITGDMGANSMTVSKMDVKENGSYREALNVEAIDWVDKISF